MAYARKCDRCGNFYDPYTKRSDSGPVNSLQLLETSMDGIIRQTRKTFDLCPECMNKIINFLENKEEDDGGQI